MEPSLICTPTKNEIIITTHSQDRHPFPSFEVYDLETVDNGVIKHLFPLPDADFTIAHFLGVDHAGHRYGPNHPEMARKLRQMNGIVERVIEELPEDTVLMVWGDHGMNSVGDHGGESEDEVTAALFIYPSEAEAQTVPQIDLVPTTAYLLQIPIPVENLGKVITGIFPPQDHLTLLQHNAQQIHRYLQLIGVKTELPNTLNEEVYERYIIEAQATARTLWATFDKRAIAAGICLLTIVIGVVLWQTLNIRDPVSVAKSIPVWQYLQVLVTAIYVFSLGAVRFVEFEDHLAALAAVIMIILSPSPLRKKLTAGLLIIGTCYITCCRVEQGPTCHSTYQASTTPIWVLYVIPFVAIAASDDFEIMLQLLLICIYWARPSGVLAAGIALLACLSRTTRRTLLTLTMLHQTPISGAALMAFLLQSRLVESSPWLNFVLAHHYYFRTGHQATLSSLQWTSAFVFTSRVIPIINGISIVLNTFGPIIVVLTTNVKFLNTASWRLEILPWMIATAVTMVTCGMLRRHLLVWPIFAPRFMLAASFLICAELVLGIIRHCNKIGSIQDGLKAKDEVKRAIQSQEGSPTG